ncbi:hypothetical protein BGX38DRAFT_1264481 [Terfezia claveryi]|nr:hypothetical protein BGX38DRAFT_1264481 [Terfezia claveryi]
MASLRAGAQSWDRQPAPLALPTRPSDFVFVVHPGYADRAGTLFKLPAYDSFVRGSSGTSWGIHHGLVLRACEIVSGNTEGILSTLTFDELLNTECNANWEIVFRRHCAQRDINEILLPGRYFFYVHNFEGNRQYAICDSFRSWSFPDMLPPEWSIPTEPSTRMVLSVSAYSEEVRLRDEVCKISKYWDGSQVAHIVPKDEVEWFVRNGLGIYNANQMLRPVPENQISDVNNLILLRSDIHYSFDIPTFVFAPKGTPAQYVVHFLSPTVNYSHLYHNCIVDQLDVPAEFLYARFAWSIFRLLAGFYAGRKRPAGAEDVVLVEGTRGEVPVAKTGRTTTSRGWGSSMSGKPTTTTTTTVATPEVTDDNQPGTAGGTAAHRWRKAYPTLGQEPSCSQYPAWHDASYYPEIEYFPTGAYLKGKGTIPACVRASTDDKGGIGDRGIVGRR